MNKPVIITAAANIELDAVVFYLITNWGKKVTDNFLSLYNAKVSIIANSPHRYPIIDHKKKIRKAVLTKHNIILYRETDKFIEIISVFDTRQDPDKMPLL